MLVTATTKPEAHISVDLDPVDAHLLGYGIRRQACDRIYRTSVPRILDLLDKIGIKATFFAVARDADCEATLLRAIASRGHEIGSHSLTHPKRLTGLPTSQLWRETKESRERLENALGAPVLGFRAPGWDTDKEVLTAIASAGYLYDASVFPGSGLALARILRFFLSRRTGRDLSLSRLRRAASASRYPHQVVVNGTQLWEFPVTVSPVLRLPFLQTTWHLLPHAVCWRVYRACHRSGNTLCYQFHAVDLLDLKTDGVDQRMARHPGMKLRLSRKLALLEGILRRIAEDYQVRTYGEAVSSGTAQLVT